MCPQQSPAPQTCQIGAQCARVPIRPEHRLAAHALHHARTVQNPSDQHAQRSESVSLAPAIVCRADVQSALETCQGERSEVLGTSDAQKGSREVRKCAHAGRAAGVAMSGYHPGRVGGGGSKRAAHQLVDLMTSISTPQASQSRSAGLSLQQKDARRVSPYGLAAQRWPS